MSALIGGAASAAVNLANGTVEGNLTVTGLVTTADLTVTDDTTLADAITTTATTALTSSTQNVVVSATGSGKTVRLNSVTKTGTTDSNIGFQSKPAVGESTAQNVIGGEISPRVNDTFALTGSGSIIGLHVDAYLKGTTGNIAGDMRGLQIELVDDGSSSRTVAGKACGIRFRNALSTAVTGLVVPMSIENGELATKWEALAHIEAEASVFSATGTVSTQAGYLKVFIDATAAYIPLYTTLD